MLHLHEFWYSRVLKKGPSISAHCGHYAYIHTNFKGVTQAL